MKKASQLAIIIIFGAIVLTLAAAHLLLPDAAFSTPERRSLKKPPAVTVKTVFSGSFSDDMESYLLDQFPLRDAWRAVKASFGYDILFKQDNNGIYREGDSLCKLDGPLDVKQVQYAANRMNSVIDAYLNNSTVYYSVIPDKGYFAAHTDGRPALDYDRILELVSGVNAQYIDIFPYLCADDYYRTDSHWRQERISAAANALIEGMGAQPLNIEYTEHTLYPFKGVYLGQSALNIAPEELTYLTSAYTDTATVASVELEGELPVYDETRFYGVDGYDVFLYGAQAVVTVTSANAPTNRELVIFRDSFGSSIAPLFLGAYSKVTLIDLRYISSSLIGDYAEFDGADVLFLYSGSLLNSGMLLK